MYWNLSYSDPWPLVNEGKKPSGKEGVSVSGNPVIIPRVLADWVIGELDETEAFLTPAECKPIQFTVAANADHWKVRIPNDACAR